MFDNEKRGFRRKVCTDRRAKKHWITGGAGLVSKRCVRRAQKLGGGHAGGLNGKIIFKSGSEPAMKALRTAIAKYHGGTVIPEAPAKGESQSNGAIEEAGETVREYLRIFKG